MKTLSLLWCLETYQFAQPQDYTVQDLLWDYCIFILGECTNCNVLICMLHYIGSLYSSLK